MRVKNHLLTRYFCIYSVAGCTCFSGAGGAGLAALAGAAGAGASRTGKTGSVISPPGSLNSLSNAVSERTLVS
jgi:hypothetical protein